MQHAPKQKGFGPKGFPIGVPLKGYPAAKGFSTKGVLAPPAKGLFPGKGFSGPQKGALFPGMGLQKGFPVPQPATVAPVAAREDGPNWGPQLGGDSSSEESDEILPPPGGVNLVFRNQTDVRKQGIYFINPYPGSHSNY